MAAHASDAATFPSIGADSERAVKIEVQGGDWDGASPDDIQLLLNAVATELLAHFPGRRLDPIVVSRSLQGPVVLFQKGSQNQSQVRLAAGGRRWGEYIYEFSHEMFHILANYQYRAPPKVSQYQWFEEMLCETASLYMLKQFTARWEQAPPRTQWVSYAPSLQRFTQRALTEQHRRLPPNISFAQWFRDNGPALRASPYLRDKNELVASYFLPILEQHQDWRAFAFLNPVASQPAVSFNDYLLGWQARTPATQRELVARSIRIFQPERFAPGTRMLATVERTAPELPQETFALGTAGPSAHERQE
jgi:hypothetical protein